MQEIISYLKNGTFPKDKKIAQKLWIKSTRYTVEGNIKFKRGYMVPLLRCINEDEVTYVMKKIHKVICENHASVHSLAQKAL